jgi:hypothetical protein
VQPDVVGRLVEADADARLATETFLTRIGGDVQRIAERHDVGGQLAGRQRGIAGRERPARGQQEQGDGNTAHGNSGRQKEAHYAIGGAPT